MIYDKVNFLSLYGKRLNKINDLRFKLILTNFRKGSSPSSPSIKIDSNIDKALELIKSKKEPKKKINSFHSFLRDIQNYSKIEKKEKKNYFSKLKGYKNYEEEKLIKERRERRYKEIINLKKKREFLESQKLFPNYNEIFSSMIPYLKNEKSLENSKEYLTERNNFSKIGLSENKNRKNNNTYFSISSLPNINNKIIKPINIKKISIVGKLPKKNNYVNKSSSNFLFNREKILLSNLNSKNNNISFLSNNKKPFIEFNKQFTLNNNSVDDSNIFLKSNKNKSPMNKKIIKKLLNINMNTKNKSNNHKDMKRSISSLIIRDKNDKNNSIIKTPIKFYKYQKKWNSPKAISFDKIIGRYDNKKKNNEIKGEKNYFPNYEAIYNDNKKSLVSYGNNKGILLKKFKINSTRKLISNLHDLINSQSNSYRVIDINKKEKIKRFEEKIEKLKEKFGQFYEIAKKNK